MPWSRQDYGVYWARFLDEAAIDAAVRWLADGGFPCRVYELADGSFRVSIQHHADDFKVLERKYGGRARVRSHVR